MVSAWKILPQNLSPAYKVSVRQSLYKNKTLGLLYPEALTLYQSGDRYCLGSVKQVIA
jgi:hypothetical protein